MQDKDEKKSDQKPEEVLQEPKEVQPEPKEAEASDKARCEELLDKYLRLQAEFDNYKKRSFRERAEFIKFANEGLILELVGILDNFELGVRSAEQKKDFDLLHQGVDMISKQLHSLLESKGLVRIKSKGEKFDPHKHEALEVIEDEKVKDDTVVEELQPGYTLNGRILRPAKVKVARKKIQDEVIEEEEE